jgi:hypothetical protein
MLLKRGSLMRSRPFRGYVISSVRETRGPVPTPDHSTRSLGRWRRSLRCTRRHTQTALARPRGCVASHARHARRCARRPPAFRSIAMDLPPRVERNAGARARLGRSGCRDPVYICRRRGGFVPPGGACPSHFRASPWSPAARCVALHPSTPPPRPGPKHPRPIRFIAPLATHPRPAQHPLGCVALHAPTHAHAKVHPQRNGAASGDTPPVHRADLCQPRTTSACRGVACAGPWVAFVSFHPRTPTPGRAKGPRPIRFISALDTLCSTRWVAAVLNRPAAPLVSPWPRFTFATRT